MQVKSLKGVLKLRFELPEYNVFDWFEVHRYSGMIFIKSGLRHAYCETRSPYFYEETTFGKGAKKEALRKFNEFLKTLKDARTVCDVRDS